MLASHCRQVKDCRHVAGCAHAYATVYMLLLPQGQSWGSVLIGFREQRRACRLHTEGKSDAWMDYETKNHERSSLLKLELQDCRPLYEPEPKGPSLICIVVDFKFWLRLKLTRVLAQRIRLNVSGTEPVSDFWRQQQGWFVAHTEDTVSVITLMTF